MSSSRLQEYAWGGGERRTDEVQNVSWQSDFIDKEETEESGKSQNLLFVYLPKVGKIKRFTSQYIFNPTEQCLKQTNKKIYWHSDL